MGKVTFIGESETNEAMRGVFEDIETPCDLRVYHTSCNYGRDGLNWHPVRARETQYAAITQAHVKMPKMFTRFSDAKEFQDRTGRLVWSRSHSEVGSGTGIVKQLEREADYWVQYVPHESEWRVNVGRQAGSTRYRSIGYGKKNFTNEEPGQLDWRFTLINNGPDEIVEAAQKAAKAVGYDFTAVDVLWTGEDAVVLECNKSPDMRGRFTKGWYKNFFMEWAEVGYTRA